MTELEAEALARRLERIWNPKRNAGLSCYYIGSDRVSFGGEISPDVYLSFSAHEGMMTHALLTWEKCEMEYIRGEIDSYYVEPATPEEWHVLIYEFDGRWLEFFRRGCWLSSCPIEASAHEKSEWIQGFTREELEAWNLKI